MAKGTRTVGKVLWVVTGRAGDYEDKSWWIVRIFRSEIDALAFVREAVAEAKRVCDQERPRWDRYWADHTGKVKLPKRLRSKLDSSMHTECAIGEVPYYSIEPSPLDEGG
jgi:hypothetical protein